MAKNGYSSTQLKMLNVLKDGYRHSYDELHACLPDELASVSAIQQQLSHIRKYLRPKGQEIICEFFERRRWYRHVVLLPSANDGRT